VGRTLLSDAFDLDFGPFAPVLFPPGSQQNNNPTKIKFKGVGQECPTHTLLADPLTFYLSSRSGYHGANTIVEKYSNQRVDFVSIFGVVLKEVYFR
jgi:hypothetical protein